MSSITTKDENQIEVGKEGSSLVDDVEQDNTELTNNGVTTLKETANTTAKFEKHHQEDTEIRFYMDDAAFKDSLIGNDINSMELRSELIESVTGTTPGDLMVIITEQNAKSLDGKKGTPDVVLFDQSTFTYYDIEMQNSRNLLVHQMRFQMYPIMMLSDLAFAGSSYLEIHHIVQIIFVNDYSKKNKLIRTFTSRDDDGNIEESNASITRNYIYLKEIDALVKQKGIDNLTNLEKLCFAYLYLGKDVTMITDKGSMVTNMEIKYHMFKNSLNWPLGYTPEQEEQNRLDCLKIEREEGSREARIDLLMNQMKLKYGSDEDVWIKTLTTEQMDLLSKSMFTDDTLDELKNKIN